MTSESVIKIRDLVTGFGNKTIHDHLDLDVKRGEILGVVGGSGSGKTVLVNTILNLLEPKQGSIRVFNMNNTDPKLQSRWGVLFQSGALFSSLTVGENIEVPMREVAGISHRLAKELIALKLKMVGLEPDDANKYPAELSGGMIKRAALARCLALDAELLFLDEPTAGLDPISAAAFDNLLKTLQRNLNLTVVMITHDIDTLNTVCDRVGALVDKKMTVETLKDIKKNPHPWIQSYFHGTRGREVFGD
ncbi:MAG: ABC transporter ATP-binding protein [Alphaproteobacteria bacterium]